MGGVAKGAEVEMGRPRFTTNRRDARWTRRILHWIPYGGERRRGRPATRWEDSLEAYAREYGSKWEFLAEDRGVWSAWEGGYVQRAMIRKEARQPDVDSGDDAACF